MVFDFVFSQKLGGLFQFAIPCIGYPAIAARTAARFAAVLRSTSRLMRNGNSRYRGRESTV